MNKEIKKIGEKIITFSQARINKNDAVLGNNIRQINDDIKILNKLNERSKGKSQRDRELRASRSLKVDDLLAKKDKLTLSTESDNRAWEFFKYEADYMLKILEQRPEGDQKTLANAIIEKVKDLNPPSAMLSDFLKLKEAIDDIYDVDYDEIASDSFRAFKTRSYNVYNARNLDDIYKVYLKIIHNELQDELHYMTLRFSDDFGKSVFITIKPSFLYYKDEMEERIIKFLNGYGGSDQLLDENLHLDMDFMKLTSFGLIGNGKSDFIFCDVLEVGDPELGNCYEQCLRHFYGNLPDEELKEKGEELTIYADYDVSLTKAETKFTLNTDMIKINDERYYPFKCKLKKIQEGGPNAVVWSNEHYAIFVKTKYDVLYIGHDKCIYDYTDGKLTKLLSRPKLNKLKSKLMDEKREDFEVHPTYIFFDYETIFDKNSTGLIKPYSLCWIITQDFQKYDINFRYGWDCTEAFIQYLQGGEEKMFILIGYNNSRFDNFLLAEKLLKADMLNDIFYQNNSILNMKFGGRHQTFDLCRFTLSSLKNACNDFNVKHKKKGDFDHNVIQKVFNETNSVDSYFNPTCRSIRFQYDTKVDEAPKFDTTQFYKLVEYNIYDCLATAEIYEKISKEIMTLSSLKNKKKFFDYKTIGSVIWAKFKESDECKKLPMLELEDYKRVRSGLCAGRVQCFKGNSKHDGPIDVLDVKSEYPYVMLNRKYPCGKIIQLDYKDKGSRIGFYNCKITQPIKNKILPHKYDKEAYDWNFDEPFVKFINTVDIECLLRNGAQVEILQKDNRDDGFCFEDLIDGKELFACMAEFKKVKEEEDQRKGKENYNPVRRNMAKIFLNSLSGKVIESLHVDKTMLIKNTKDYTHAINQHEGNDKPELIHKIDSQRGIIKIKISEEKALKSGNRPIYLGCLIYAYAREHLYENIIKQTDVLYCDTDSGFIPSSDTLKLKDRTLYKAAYSTENKALPFIGDQFGQFEIEKSGITSLYTLSAKNYFALKDGKVVKQGFKGINLINDKLINLEDELYTSVKERFNKKNDKLILTGDLEDQFNLYHTDLLFGSLKEEKNLAILMENLLNKKPTFILCSNIQKVLKTSKDNSKVGSNMYQRFIIKSL